MVMGNLTLCGIISIFSVILKFVPFTLFFALGSNANDTITQGQVFRDGQILVSAGGSFEFGFFSPPNSTLRYVGIWYSNTSVQSVIWVANRNTPIMGKDGSLSIGSDGNLIILDGKERIVWSSNSSANCASKYTGTLVDDGNFLIRSIHCNSIAGSYGICWQSFDHPTDTYLPGMRVHFNENKGEIHTFTSWKSESDPSSGNYSMGVDPRAAPQIVIWEGANRRWRSGFFTGMMFTGVPTMTVFYSSGFKISNADPQGNLYFTYSPSNRSYTSFEFKITWDGFEKSFFRVNGGHDWNMLQMEPSHPCDVYNKCGAHGYCSMAGSTICNCFQGFKPKYQDQWDSRNWSGGCVRKTTLQCETNNSLIRQDSFLEVHNVKLPDFAGLFDEVGDKQGCEKQCLQTCSCRAYAFVTGIGCMAWGDELIDIQQFSSDGNTLHIRVAGLDTRARLSGPKIAAIVLSVVSLLCIIIFFLWKFRSQVKVLQTKRYSNEGLTIQLRKSQGYSTEISGSQEISRDQDLVKAQDLPMFNYNLVASATNFFSEENKLGEGGFGPVYKGMLPDGQEIAVKKLSRKSGQGMEEFKNEILLIAKLQHRNLVRILGFCMDGEEKMLIYEYMPKKSLDGCIFGQQKQGQLDWRKRSTIIEGVARGLLYLHRDARCKIIHRDLKASNILLDQDMNAKISDFGMARMFGGDQQHMNTNRVVGTYGYMSPEYAMEGIFSEKSDVYSFGVLLLEIITGRRNTSFRSSEYVTLVEYAWQIWKEGKAVELVDSSIRNSSPSDEVSRYVHIAMLCVQDSAVYRPVMSQVVLWLESDSVALPIPKEPTLTHSFFKGSVEIDSRNEVHDVGSLTISTMVPR